MRRDDSCFPCCGLLERPRLSEVSASLSGLDLPIRDSKLLRSGERFRAERGEGLRRFLSGREDVEPPSTREGLRDAPRLDFL